MRLRKIILVWLCTATVFLAVQFNASPENGCAAGAFVVKPEKTPFSESDSWSYKVFNTQPQDFILDVAWRPQADYCFLVGSRTTATTREAIAYKINLDDNTVYSVPTGLSNIYYFRGTDWHPTGDYAAVVGDFRWMHLWLFDGSSFRQVYSASGGRYQDVAWHPSGDYALLVGQTTYTAGGIVHRYDDGGTSYTDITPTNSPPIYTVSWQPNGAYALIGGSGLLLAYNLSSGFSPISQDYTIFDISWHPDGNSALLVGVDAAWNGVVLEHTLNSASVTELFSVPTQLSGVAWKPTGNFALICGRNRLYEYDGTAFSQILTPPVLYFRKMDWLPSDPATERYSYAVVGGNISAGLVGNGAILKYRQNDAYVDTQLTPVLDSETDAPNIFADAYQLTLVGGQFAGFGYLDGDDTADWYKFSVSAGEMIKIDLTPPADADFDIYLYDNTNTLRKSSSNPTGQPESIRQVADYTGDWYLEIERYRYEDAGTYSFSISIGVGVILTKPFGGEDWTGGSHHNIEWYVGGGSPPYTITLRYSTDSGASYPNVIDVLTNRPGGFGFYDWLVPIINCTTTRVKIEVSDSTAQTAEDESFLDFEIDSTPPSVVFVSPADGETNVPLDKPIVIKFSEPMNISATENAFNIAPDPGGFSWGWNITSDTMTGTHNNFAENRRYLCNLLTSAKDDSDPGNNLQRPYSWQFTTLSTRLFVEVKSPNGGERWQVGSVENIRWLAGGGAQPLTIKILYSTTGPAGQFVEIASNEANDGIYEWQVPPPESNNCFVKIIATDQARNTAEDISDSNFTIYRFVDNPPVVAVLRPGGGETLINGTKYSIKWTATDDKVLPAKPISIKYSIDNGINWIRIVDRTENNGIYEWLVPDVESTDCLINVSCTDSANQIGYALSGKFTIRYSTNPPPRVHIISPSAGTIWYIGGTYEIAWTAEDSDLAEKPFNISYSTNGLNWTDIATELSNQTTVYNWHIPSIEPSASCYIKITAYDCSNQLTTAISDRFTIILLYRIEVKPTPVVIECNLKQQFYAYGYDINSNPVAVDAFSWTAEPAGIGTVDSKGLFQAGSTAMEGWVNASSLTEGVLVKGCANVTVKSTALTIDYVTIEPKKAVLKIGEKIEFFATAFNGTNVLAAVMYNWSLTAANIGTLSTTQGMNTTFSAIAAGVGNIVVNATYRNVSKEAFASIEVRAPVARILVLPQTATLKINEQKQFKAKAYDADNNLIPYEVVFEWRVEGEIGVIRDGLFTATAAGIGKVIARNGTVEGFANVTVLLPDEEPPRIVHEPLKEIAAGRSITLTAYVTDNVAVKEVKLYYRCNGEKNYRIVLMQNKTDRYNFTAVIGSEFTAKSEYIEYFIEANDTSQNTARSPTNAPQKVHKITIMTEKFYFNWLLLIILIVTVCIIVILAAIAVRKSRAEKARVKVVEAKLPPKPLPTVPPPVPEPISKAEVVPEKEVPPEEKPVVVAPEKKVPPPVAVPVPVPAPAPPPPEKEKKIEEEKIGVEKKVEEEKKVKPKRRPSRKKPKKIVRKIIEEEQPAEMPEKPVEEVSEKAPEVEPEKPPVGEPEDPPSS